MKSSLLPVVVKEDYKERGSPEVTSYSVNKIVLCQGKSFYVTKFAGRIDQAGEKYLHERLVGL